MRNGVYKLGDLGCATLLEKSLPIEEGDAGYMPQEILNEKCRYLLIGSRHFELIRGSPLPESGPQILNLREGKFPLLPGHSLQFQNLLQVMLDPNPVWRPSAKDLVENPIFDKVRQKWTSLGQPRSPLEENGLFSRTEYSLIRIAPTMLQMPEYLRLIAPNPTKSSLVVQKIVGNWAKGNSPSGCPSKN
ncbi:hypothetical protein DVH24_002688 [Malus domestica]|uniref:Protein kinase domain-containing protein n=1 Tax=Malus domestica TaxID=3750 RepID=A0A498K370_MALDO|nr:hypothetical protein DVH24_002688 [Malus domestica]